MSGLGEPGSQLREQALVVERETGGAGNRVELSNSDGSVRVEIRDNGGGGANLADGSGIRGLADRVEALGGRFELQSPVGTGTVVRAELPLR